MIDWLFGLTIWQAILLVIFIGFAWAVAGFLSRLGSLLAERAYSRLRTWWRTGR